jgi:hypothetical protein
MKMKCGRRRRTTYFISAWDRDCPNSTEKPTKRRALLQALRLYRQGYRDIEIERMILTNAGRFGDNTYYHISPDGSLIKGRKSSEES